MREPGLLGGNALCCGALCMPSFRASHAGASTGMAADVSPSCTPGSRGSHGNHMTRGQWQSVQQGAMSDVHAVPFPHGVCQLHLCSVLPCSSGPMSCGPTPPEE